ncbi:MAG TPA: nucleotidyl transferase AbiEii/AbiGii toxin family protein [Cellvibrionaceae bacterium]|nr:nucleotidyl transferase AbiEii/AbiGii toxin family protein [Cellvibrionaceae bacterium]HNG58409.1 nucleotidyl transferase AbiEii/AbiGii toxin family protein [Cellvibrionaceae bacterium]
MTAPSLNISQKIEPSVADLCAIVAGCAMRLQIPYLVVGASARDMVLHYGYAAKVQRATADIDFALQVPSWAAFAALRRELIRNNFSETIATHRLIGPNNWPIDIVPFGGVADERANIQWPPSGDFVMSVLGFVEALNHANIVRLSDMPILDVPVASPEGMTMLKFIAWTDRAADARKKDAKDIAYLLTTYENIPAVSDQLYRELTLMELYSWDITLASAHQLGINVKQMALPQTRSVISDVLNKQSAKLSVEKLINEMCENPDQYARNAMLIDAFGAGFFS